MASCGDAFLPCDLSSSDSSSSNNRCSAGPAAAPGETAVLVPPSPSKLAWGGAGMVPLPSAGKGAWAPSQKTVSKASFRDLQSEDLAREITHRETQALSGQIEGIDDGGTTSKDTVTKLEQLKQQYLSAQAVGPSTPSSSDGAADASDSTENDHLLAQMLQYEFDLQHDMQIELNQRQTNKNSKLCINYNKFKLLPSFVSEKREGNVVEEEPVDEIEAGEMDEPLFPACGYVQHEGVMVTKHDFGISSRKNAKKMLNLLPLDVNTGDAGGFTINMPNKVFNNLNSNIMADNRRKQRVHDKSEQGTIGSHLDSGTSLALLSLVNAGMLEDIGGIISTGKEAIVYHAVAGCLETTEPQQPCVVKIFKTRLTDFKTRERYIRDDHRFKDRMTKTNNFSNIKLWVEKEYRNLCRVHGAGVPCPQPLYVRHNLLLMSLIGEPDLPAPQLRNVGLNTAHWQCAFEQTMQIVHDLVNKCRLVHADLSEYNLLYVADQVFVIDFAQAVDITHPSALSYLYRDLCNVANFFRRKGVPGVKTGVELLDDITQLNIRRCAGHSTSEQIEAAEQELDMWRGSDCYDDTIYEFLWNAAQVRQEILQKLDIADDDIPDDLLGLTLEKSGSSQKEQWIIKKTDTSIISSKGQKKKKRNRKNSGSKTTSSEKCSGDTADHESLKVDESSGFCLIDSSDCAESAPSSAEEKKKERSSQRVRFDVEDTDAVDTEDYNADADTDFDADTDDIDTDLTTTDHDGDTTDMGNTDHDGDTEGYCGDADDTDNNASDRNDGKSSTSASKFSLGKQKHLDRDDSSDQQNVPSTMRSSKTASGDKRAAKKKSKKNKGKSSIGS